MSAVATLALALIPQLAAQDAEPSNAREKAPSHPKAKAENKENPDITITYEAFSLPIDKAGELMRLHLTEDKFYKEVVATGKLERLLAMPTQSGQRANLESVTQYIYPTEFAPPQIPATFSGGPSGGPPEIKLALPVTPAAPTKNDLGDRMEFDPILSDDAKSVDLNLAVSHNALLKRGKWGEGLAEVEQPQFESQKVTTGISVSIGVPTLIGTLNPPFGNGLASHAEQVIWFCFITPTVNEVQTAAPKKDKR